MAEPLAGAPVVLTKELLRFDLREGKIRPRFIDGENRLNLALAEELIALFAAGEGESREDLEESAAPLINSHRSPLIAKGLYKLLLDRCAFRKEAGEASELRWKVFALAARQLREGRYASLEEYREGVGAALSTPADELSRQLHADLPDRQPLESFRPLSPERLLHRYNMAQAQGLFFWAGEMAVEIQNPDPGHLRAFFRHLRFFQLLALVRNPQPGRYALTLDGPMSLLHQTQKYGLKLASILPAVCAFPRWEVEAEIHMPAHRPARLVLNHESGLVSHFSRTSAYIPEEFQGFLAALHHEEPMWRAVEEAVLLDLGDQEIVTPDFTFRREDGREVHLELFHPWHRGALEHRLERLDHWAKHRPEEPPPPLLLGVDRPLLKEKGVAERLEHSPWFQQWGLLFSGFPLVKKVRALLNKM
ncbi:MAG: DUF790 family protein [Magnetococcales bacterium]|nr:DUF790 family protein [Magnetococcales bacterium]